MMSKLIALATLVTLGTCQLKEDLATQNIFDDLGNDMSDRVKTGKSDMDDMRDLWMFENDNSTNATDMELTMPDKTPVPTRTPMPTPPRSPTMYPTPMPTMPTTRFTTTFSAKTVAAIPTEAEFMAMSKAQYPNLDSVKTEVHIKPTRTFCFPGTVVISAASATTVVADVFDVPEDEVTITMGGRRLSSEDLAEGRKLNHRSSFTAEISTTDRAKAAAVSARPISAIASEFVQAYMDETAVTLPNPTVGEATIEVQVDVIIVSNDLAVVLQPPTAAAFRAALIAVKPEAATELGEPVVTTPAPTMAPTNYPTPRPTLGAGETYSPTMGPTNPAPTPTTEPTEPATESFESPSFLGAPLAKAALAIAALAALLAQ